MRTTHLLGLSPIVLLLACGGGGSDEVAIDDLSAELAAASCHRIFECCDDAEVEQELGFFDAKTEDECVTVISGFSEQFFVPPLRAGIEQGRITYHPDRMADCIATFRSLECDEPVDDTGVGLAGIGCEDPFEGHLADGEACATDEECANDSCLGDSIDFQGNVTQGICGDPPVDGESCGNNEECAGGSWCDTGAPDGATCVEPLADGADCRSDNQCASGHCDDPDTTDAMPGTCSSEPYCDGA